MYAPISELVTGERRTVGAPGFTFVNGSLGLVLLALTGIGPVIAWRKASVESLRRSFLAPSIVAIVVGVAMDTVQQFGRGDGRYRKFFIGVFVQPGSMPFWRRMASVWGCFRKSINARPSASRAVPVTSAANVVETFCTSGGSRPPTSAPSMST